MSITDELREYADRFNNSHDAWSGIGDDLLAIADRIDAEFAKAAYTDARAMLPEMAAYMNDEDLAECGLVRLPTDADGVPIRIGDLMGPDGRKVVRVTLCEDGRHRGWFEPLPGLMHEFYCDEVSHHHAPTTEDVLREFLDACDGQNDGFRSSLVAEYAKRLTIKEDA